MSVVRKINKAAEKAVEFQKKEERYASDDLKKIIIHYESAKEQLVEVPYSQRLKPLNNFLLGFRSVYHFFSVLLGIATCVLASLVFVGMDVNNNQNFPDWLLVLMAVFVGTLLVGILVAVELAKITLAKNIFKAKAKKNRVGNSSIVGLTFFVLVSVGMSGAGGALLSYQVGDKTKQLDKDLKSGEQKIAKQYDKRLLQLNQVIAGLEALSIDKKNRRWGLTKKEQTNLQASKSEKQQILSAKAKSTAKLDGQHKARLGSNQTHTLMTMYIAIGLIIFLELVTIYAYLFHYQYLVKTEGEGEDYGILFENDQVADDQPKKDDKPHNSFIEALLISNNELMGKLIGNMMLFSNISNTNNTGNINNSANTMSENGEKESTPPGFKPTFGGDEVIDKEEGIGFDQCVDVINKYHHVAVDNDNGLSITAIEEKYKEEEHPIRVGRSTIQKVRTVQRILRKVGKYYEVMSSIEKDKTTKV